MAALLLIGGVTVALLEATGNLPGNSMDTVWETPADPAAAEHGNGYWQAGDTLVRSRFDAVTGYHLKTGKQRWTYVPEGRSEICSTSAPDASVLLVVRGENVSAAEAADEGCATVTALDLKTGRELWSSSRKASAKAAAGRPMSGTVAAGGGLGVIIAAWTDEIGKPVADGRRAIRAVDLHTGARRWTATLPEDCGPFSVGAANRKVAAVLNCGEGRRAQLEAATFDPATGALLHHEPLDARRPVDPVSSSAPVKAVVLSTDPLVVSVRPSGDYEPGTDAFFSFGADGRRLARIESSGDYGKIVSGKPAKVAVDGEHLYAVAQRDSSSITKSRAVAIDLTSGRLVWQADYARGNTLALAARDGRVSVLHERARHQSMESLYVLDGATGEEIDDRNFAKDLDRNDRWLAGLLDTDGLVIVSRYDTEGPGRPFVAYERW
ncbi:PQQ-binding-like beta-propeller repeat protein [Streptomyces sp. KL116D]|uniref:outer membrane protein assembly factor BamB family protein n=1 Tax=Streptomyces sp. KL116D TaxID=3045152 RepID=UPI00355789A7